MAHQKYTTELVSISNTSNWSGVPATIEIKKGDPGWDEALARWKNGQNPTDHPAWKKGVIAHFDYVLLPFWTRVKNYCRCVLSRTSKS